MTASDKLHIYDLLMTSYSVGDRVPLSALGNFLRSHDITPIGMGYEKLLGFFEDLSEICTLDSVEPRPGVPPVWYVTLLSRPDPEEVADGQTPLTVEQNPHGLPPYMTAEQVFFPINLQNILSDNIAGQQGTRASAELLLRVREDYRAALESGIIYHDTARDTYDIWSIHTLIEWG